MKQNQAKQLKKIQDELVDTIITKPQDLKKIIQVQLNARKGFHPYSLNNLVLANFQLLEQNGEGLDGEGIELLAPYKKWAEHGRHVRKGEKALRILAPIFKTERDEDGNEINKTLLYFKSVPVFDLSQTDGERLETDFTSSDITFTLEEIINRGKVKVNFSNKELTRGYTNGKEIWVSKHTSVNNQICTYFHELAHYYLHFNKDRKEFNRPTKELEAEAVSYLVSCYLGIQNDEAPAYILNWTEQYSDEERTELLKGKGNKVLQCATNIISLLRLDDLLDTKLDLNEASEEISVEV